MSDTTTTVAQRMFDHGYKAARVEGRFWAWRRKLRDGTELRVCTIDYDLDGDPAAEDWYLGRHSETGEFIECGEAMTLAQALALADQIPSPLTPQGDCQRTLRRVEISAWSNGIHPD